MNGYVALFNGKRAEIIASTLWEAVQKARVALKVPKSKWGLLSVIIAEKDGNPVIHQPAM